jgi:sulfur-carrier protein adenylyltransferase/sulfurtransferase
MPSLTELLALAREQIAEIEPPDLEGHLDDGDMVLLDVREKAEWDEGHIPGAQHVPRGYLELRIEDLSDDRKNHVVLYCSTGIRSLLAAQTLRDMGYEKARSLAGGFTSWKHHGLPFILPRALNPSQSVRYSRHLLIPEIGEEGQMTLLSSKVLVLGMGGLGSPTAMYLAAAGVGTLGIVDSDVVEESNLQRQIIHGTGSVGMAKVASARQTLNSLNPDVAVVSHQARLDEENAEEIISGYDVVVDGSDNFETRYLVNDVCVRNDIPNVSASILAFDGQLTTLVPHEGPCYRCLFPYPPPASLAPT